MLTPEDVGPNVVPHRPTCPAPNIKVRPGYERGVYVVTCRKCSTFALVDESGALILAAPRPVATTPATTPDTSATTEATGRFRCPEHGTPVTWRGTGCNPCQHDRTTYRSRRLERRAAALTDLA